MRGRHSAAILEMMGIAETIAVRLANDPQARHALGRRIAEAKHRLYRDRACISALEQFLERAARPL